MEDGKPVSDLFYFLPYYFLLIIVGLIFTRPLSPFSGIEQFYKKNFRSSTSLDASIIIDSSRENDERSENSIVMTEESSQPEEPDINFGIQWVAKNTVCKSGSWYELSQEEAEKMTVHDCALRIMNDNCNHDTFSFSHHYEYVCSEGSIPRSEPADTKSVMQVTVEQCKDSCDDFWRCHSFTHSSNKKGNRCFLKEAFDYSNPDMKWKKKAGHSFCYRKPVNATCFCVENKCLDNKGMTASKHVTTYRIFPIELPPKLNPMKPVSNLDKWNNYIRETYEEERYTQNWYARTEFRDDMNGGWHNFHKHGIEMCSIGKCGTRSWRPMFGSFGKEENDVKENFRFMVWRDPMERMLSAFLHLCYDRGSFINHCLPKDIFDGIDRKWRHFPKKLFIQEFVDVMPMMWNVHFMPLHTFCKQWHRSYDMILMMNSTFSDQLLALRDRVPSENFKKLMNRTFHLANVSPTKNKPKTGQEKVLRYFNTRIVKRLLKYYVRDYIELEIPLPDWLDLFEFG